MTVIIFHNSLALWQAQDTSIFLLSFRSTCWSDRTEISTNTSSCFLFYAPCVPWRREWTDLSTTSCHLFQKSSNHYGKMKIFIYLFNFFQIFSRIFQNRKISYQIVFLFFLLCTMSFENVGSHDSSQLPFYCSLIFSSFWEGRDISIFLIFFQIYSMSIRTEKSII